MEKVEIREFIEEMAKIGDIWSEEQVEEIYGEQTLDRAVKNRKLQLEEMPCLFYMFFS